MAKRDKCRECARIRAEAAERLKRLQLKRFAESIKEGADMMRAKHGKTRP